MKYFSLFTLLFFSELIASDGEMLYKQNCQNCHGSYGQLAALGHSEPIMGWSSTKLGEALLAYKNGMRNTNGMGTYMQIKMQMRSKEEIDALAKYISSLKKEN